MARTVPYAPESSTRHQDSRIGEFERFRINFKIGPFLLAKIHIYLLNFYCDEALISQEEWEYDPSLEEDIHLHATSDRDKRPKLTWNDRYVAYVVHRYDRYWVNLDGDYQSYFNNFSKKPRKNLRRRINRMAELSGGSIDIRHYRTREEMIDFYPSARDVSARTFQEKLHDDGIPDNEEFYADMLMQAERGAVCGSILMLNGQPISFLYFVRRKRRLTAIYGGFDPEHAKLSPGTVHLLLCIERFFEEPDYGVFDFGQGTCDYKEFFATDGAPCADVLILRKTPRNVAIVCCHQGLALVTSAIMGLLHGMRLKQFFSQKLRGR